MYITTVIDLMNMYEQSFTCDGHKGHMNQYTFIDQ